MQHADSVRLLTDEQEILPAVQTLIEQSAAIVDDLEQWQSDLTARYNGRAYWHAPSLLYSSLPPDSPDRIFPTMLVFPSLVTAFHLTTLWSCLLLLQSNLFLTYRQVRTQHPSIPIETLPNPPQHTHSVCFSLAVLITQSLEHFLQPDTGLVGAQQVGFPISVVLGYFSFFDAREMLWIRVIFRRLEELNVGIEGFLASMFNESGLQLMIP